LDSNCSLFSHLNVVKIVMFLVFDFYCTLVFCVYTFYYVIHLTTKPTLESSVELPIMPNRIKSFFKVNKTSKDFALSFWGGRVY
jgi:hypothetical protein